jgi:ATP-dependent Clp protease ATP-binding subunit ClpA
LNRIDDIVVFNPLDESIITGILDVLLQNVVDTLKQKDIEISFSDELKKYLIKV